jgi:hypothetical protein
MLACLLFAVGCHDDAVGARPALPMVSDLGGPRLAHPRLVAIFYSDDADADGLTRYIQWIATSSWIATVGADYGVGAGSVAGIVRKTEVAPDRLSDTAIVDLLYQDIAAGTLPAPPPGELGDLLYIVNFPAHTTITTGDATSCVEFAGYHGSARRGGVELAYAVVPSCPGAFRDYLAIEAREYAMSHELIEAATDPVPFNHPAFQLLDPIGTWSGLGGEVADLCTRSDASGAAREAGFVATRSWSNSASVDGDPCVPIAATTYFNVIHDGTSLPRIPPGGHQTLHLTGVATAAISDWSLQVSSGKSNVTLSLGAQQLNAGQTTSLDIAVPASTPIGTELSIFVFSGESASNYQVLPMSAVVGAPCSTFTTCTSCAAQSGCGFCTTTGRCEAEGVAGSAESSCSGSAFARWPGSCGGFCAGHSGTCQDCSSQTGCGWCATSTPRCLEASDAYSGPASGSCAYADWAFTPDYCTP